VLFEFIIFPVMWGYFMVLFRQSMIFAQSVGNTFANINGQTWGWTENYVNDHPDLSAAINDVSTLANRRFRMLGRNSTLTFVRSQSLAGPRITRLARLQLFGMSDNGDSDIPNTAILYRGNTVLGVQRSYLVRGVPDMYVEQGGGFFPLPPWTDRSAAFFGALTVQGRGSVVQVLGVPQVIQAVTGYPEQQVATIGVTDGTQFTRGGFINIKGPRTAGAPQIRGKHKVIDVTGNIVSIKMPFAISPIYDVIAKALSAYPVVPTYTPYASFEERYSTHRITGRPLFLPRGRKPKRV
jgi:hypothetical protein